jgi:hypothetical protein
MGAPAGWLFLGGGGGGGGGDEGVFAGSGGGGAGSSLVATTATNVTRATASTSGPGSVMATYTVGDTSCVAATAVVVGPRFTG